MRLVRSVFCVLCGNVLLGVMASAHAADVADQAVQQARDAARGDRHSEAIAAFARAVQAAPHRRQQWLLEWADQHTWAGRLDEAIALYREAETDEDPATQARARLGMARALSWAGRHGLAVAQYEAVLRERPSDQEARRGLGRVLSWRGRHREAANLMRQFLQDHPHDREATIILAESLSWMGRADRALPILRAQVGADTGDLRAAKLLKQLEKDIRPQTALDYRDFNQSDGLNIRDISLGTTQSLADGRGSIGLRLGATRFIPPSGKANTIEVVRPGVQGRWRLSDALEWNGRVGVDLINAAHNTSDTSRLVHDTYLTWWPNDLLRFDLSSARRMFDSEFAVRNGLTVTQTQFSVDLLPDDLTRYSFRTHDARVSDGNRGNGWQFLAERRVWNEPRIHLGVRHNRFGFSLPGQTGYFNPEDYRSNELTLQASGWLAQGLRWQVAGATGQENVRPGDERPIRRASVRLTWEASANLSVEAAYDHSTSRTLATGGFSRGIARLSLQYRH